MRIPRTKALVLLAFAAMLVSAVAAGQVRSRSDVFISPSEIRPGMRGYGLTVFRGTAPERFDVEVIDVLTNFRPDQDLILIRTPHPILDHAHVVAGMSGSPIYLDNRLAGAYAYGWPFSSDPIAGVTPIQNMLAEMRRPVRPNSFPVGPMPRPLKTKQRRPRRTEGRVDNGTRLAGLPAYVGDAPAEATSALMAHAARMGVTPGQRSTAAIQPAATPLMVGGFSDGAVRMLEEQLSGFGLMVLQTGGGGARQPSPSAPTSYQHGSAVGVQLVSGDVSSTAVGTVTHVDGARVAAFGHPMLNAGEVGLPTTLARVLHILSSSQRSFKISEPVRAIGALVHDRQSAIVVDTNVTPATIPMRLRVQGVPGAPRTEWNTEVASHRVLTPVLVNATIASALGATAADQSDVMFEATSRVFITGRSAPIEVTDQGYSRSGPANGLGQLRLFSILEMIYGNPFQEAHASRIEVDLAVRFERETVQIVDASIAAREVDPGSTVPVRVVLRRFSHPEEVRIVPVRIPERAAGEDIEIQIQAGGAVVPEHLSPRNLEELFSIIHQRYSPNSMVISLEMPTRGMRFGGHVARHLPRSALDSLQLRNDSDRNRAFMTYDRVEVPLGQFVGGGAKIDVSVRRVPRP